MEFLKVLENTKNFKNVVSKLPFALQEKCRSIVQDKREHRKRPVLHALVYFVRREARKATYPAFGKDAMKLHQIPRVDYSSKHRSKGSFATDVVDIKGNSGSESSAANQLNTDNKSNAFSLPCYNCQGSHAFNACSFCILTFPRTYRF